MRKSLYTIFIFFLSVFIIAGISSNINNLDAQSSTPPQGNTFKPLNVSSETQTRCTAKDPSKPITSISDCKESSVLITNGITILPTGTLSVTGNKNNDADGFYVGCTNINNSKQIKPDYDEDITNYCNKEVYEPIYKKNKEKVPDNILIDTPTAAFFGKFRIIQLQDSHQDTPEERKLCTFASGKVGVVDEKDNSCCLWDKINHKTKSCEKF